MGNKERIAWGLGVLASFTAGFGWMSRIDYANSGERNRRSGSGVSHTGSSGSEHKGEVTTRLSDHPDHANYDPMVVTYVEQIAETDPESASRWAATIRDDSLRNDVLSILKP